MGHGDIYAEYGTKQKPDVRRSKIKLFGRKEDIYKKQRKGWLNSDIAWVIQRLAAMYGVLFICRVIFVLYNQNILGTINGNELGALLKGSFLFDSASVFYACSPFIFFSLLPFRFREKNWWRMIVFVSYISVGILTIALNISDTIYFSYTLKRLTADEVFFAGNDNSLRLILKFAAENWYLVIAALVLIWLLWMSYRRHSIPTTPIRNKYIYYPVNVVILALMAGLAVGGMRGGFNRTTRPITLSNASLYTNSPNKANIVLSNPFCIIRTIGTEKLSFVKYFDEETLESKFRPYHFPQTSDIAYAPLTDKNIVIFVLESFSAEHSAHLKPELYPDGDGFTPFLDSLMRDGFVFTQAFANGSKSIEVLPSVLSSTPSFKRPFVLLPQSLGETMALPAIMADRNYNTAFFCGSPLESMGFSAYARSAGVNSFFSQQDYEKERGRNDHDGFWGIWDNQFINFMGEKSGQLGEPFMSVIFTLTSHHPFVVPKEYSHLPEGRTAIHRGVRYTDMAIQDFFATYSNEDWFDNTVFVFVADHVSSESFAPETVVFPGNLQIVQFMYTPDGSLKGSYDKPAQQIDIMPTLLGLYGTKEPYFAFGRDVLNEDDRPAVIFGFTTSAMNFYIADEQYKVFFDENDITAVYEWSDRLNARPLTEPYPSEVYDLTDYLKAIIQQYYTHLETKTYTVR